MGLFDCLKCKYPLPLPGANDREYQTKDTPSQFMDQYEIREDGTLWWENYDTEDRSELTLWKAAHPGEEPPAEIRDGLSAFIGCMSKVNKRWEQVPPFTGEIRFGNGRTRWSSYFVDGKLKEIHLIEHTPQP